MIQPSNMSAHAGGSTKLSSFLSEEENEVSELVWRKTMAYMLEQPELVNKRSVYSSECGVFLACAMLAAESGDRSYYFMEKDRPVVHWPLNDAGVPTGWVAKVEDVEVLDAVGPTPGEFVEVVFSPDRLCSMKAEDSIAVCFGVEVDSDSRAVVEAVDGTVKPQARLTAYGDAMLKTWERRGMAEQARFYTAARDAYEGGGSMREAVGKVARGWGSEDRLADVVIEQIEATLAKHRELRGG